MPYPWIDDDLLQKPGVTKDLQPDWNWIRYQIGGKMFAAVCLDGENRPYYINLKLEPLEGEWLPVWAFQWHPERMAPPLLPDGGPLFAFFLGKCREKLEETP